MTVDKGIWHEALHRILEKADRRVDFAIFTPSKRASVRTSHK